MLQFLLKLLFWYYNAWIKINNIFIKYDVISNLILIYVI